MGPRSLTICGRSAIGVTVTAHPYAEGRLPRVVRYPSRRSQKGLGILQGHGFVVVEA